MKISFCTYPWAFFTPGGGEIQINKLYKYIKQYNPSINKFDIWNPQIDADVYHFFSCMGGSIHFCNYIKSIKKKLVISTSLWITKDKLCNYNINEIKSQLNLADLIVVNSEKEKYLLSNILEIDEMKFRVIYNGFESDLIKYRDKEISLHSRIPPNWTNKYIFCLANIEKRKNQDILIKACRKNSFKLVLAGYIRELDYYKSLEIDNNPEVIYFGPLENSSEEFIGLFKNCKCFVLPSTLETPGLAALEAAALGTPIIVTKEGSAQEYFGDISTYYDGKKANVEILAELIKKTFKNPDSGIVSENQIKKFTWEKCARSQLNMYEEFK